MKYNNLLETIGNTPHIRLWCMFPNNEVWIKDERRNPAGSLKDRVAVAMIEAAEASGELRPGGVIIEPTSGNTGIGLAMAGTIKGYKVILVMPESMSLERRSILKAYGAELVLTPREEGMAGSIAKADELLAATPDAWMPRQFDNKINPLAHSRTTAQEIVEDFPGGIDYLVAGVGSAGHISGLGKVLKREWPGIQIIGVEPSASPILNGGNPASHPLQGIGAGFVPKNYNPNVVDDVLTISGEEAYDMTRKLVRTEGLFAGISTGANLAGVAKIVEKAGQDATILTIAYDGGEKYMSCKGLYF